MAVLSHGTVATWGSNDSGQLGDGSEQDHSDVPVAVRGLHDATALTGGEEFAVARLGSGRVMAWGNDANSEIGSSVGNAGQSYMPVAVNGLTDVHAIAAGGADLVVVAAAR